MKPPPSTGPRGPCDGGGRRRAAGTGPSGAGGPRRCGPGPEGGGDASRLLLPDGGVEDLASRLEALFGASWRQSAAHALGLRRESLWRYASDPGRVPREVGVAVSSWEAIAVRGLAPPATPDAPFVGLSDGHPAQSVVEGPVLDALLEAAFGPRWRPRASAALGVSLPTLWRYGAFAPIPGPFKAALRALLATGVPPSPEEVPSRA